VICAKDPITKRPTLSVEPGKRTLPSYFSGFQVWLRKSAMKGSAVLKELAESAHLNLPLL
jgi:hypothetical protein